MCAPTIRHEGKFLKCRLCLFVLNTAAIFVVYAQGKPEQLSKIEGAKTLSEIEALFDEAVDEATAESC